MNVDFEKFGTWEQDKACYLMRVAKDLGMDLGGYGECSVNLNSGNTYIWLEDYPFTLYMPISCELEKADIWVLWTDPEDGEETEITLDEQSLDDLYKWVKGLEEEADE